MIPPFEISEKTLERLRQEKLYYEYRYWNGKEIEWDTFIYWLACN